MYFLLAKKVYKTQKSSQSYEAVFCTCWILADHVLFGKKTWKLIKWKQSSKIS